MTAGGGRDRMARVKLRHAARALIVDEDERVLLCRFAIREPPGTVVWAAPGGKIEPGESLLEALRRELREEVGLAVDGEPPHVWHQEVVAPGHASRHDGVINDFFLVRTAAFEPRGTLSAAELAAENITELRWWPLREIASYDGTDLFAPRDLATPLTALLADGAPAEPVRLGL